MNSNAVYSMVSSCCINTRAALLVFYKFCSKGFGDRLRQLGFIVGEGGIV